MTLSIFRTLLVQIGAIDVHERMIGRPKSCKGATKNSAQGAVYPDRITCSRRACQQGPRAWEEECTRKTVLNRLSLTTIVRESRPPVLAHPLHPTRPWGCRLGRRKRRILCDRAQSKQHGKNITRRLNLLHWNTCPPSFYQLLPSPLNYVCTYPKISPPTERGRRCTVKRSRSLLCTEVTQPGELIIESGVIGATENIEGEEGNIYRFF